MIHWSYFSTIYFYVFLHFHDSFSGPRHLASSFVPRFVHVSSCSSFDYGSFFSLFFYHSLFSRERVREKERALEGMDERKREWLRRKESKREIEVGGETEKERSVERRWRVRMVRRRD